MAVNSRLQTALGRRLRLYISAPNRIVRNGVRQFSVISLYITLTESIRWPGDGRNRIFFKLILLNEVKPMNKSQFTIIVAIAAMCVAVTCSVWWVYDYVDMEKKAELCNYKSCPKGTVSEWLPHNRLCVCK